MTLKELGEEYLSQAKMLDTLIAEKNAHLKSCGDGDRSSLEKELRILREMRQDTKATAMRLIHYYDRRIPPKRGCRS